MPVLQGTSKNGTKDSDREKMLTLFLPSTEHAYVTSPSSDGDGADGWLLASSVGLSLVIVAIVMILAKLCFKACSSSQEKVNTSSPDNNNEDIDEEMGPVTEVVTAETTKEGRGADEDEDEDEEGGDRQLSVGVIVENRAGSRGRGRGKKVSTI